MIVTKNVSEISTSDGISLQAFTMPVNEKSFSAVYKDLYMDPLESSIREILSNAVDATMQNNTFKIDVSCPTDLDMHGIFDDSTNNLSIRDYGNGLSEQQIVDIYTSFFTSTKDTDKDAIGGYGLGSKSPFAYTEMFDIISFHNGTKISYLFAIKDGIPSYAKLFEDITDEPNGLQVNIPINTSDFKKVQSVIINRCSILTNIQVKCNLVLDECLYSKPDSDIRLFKRDYNLNGLEFPSYNGNKTKISYKNVLYSLDDTRGLNSSHLIAILDYPARNYFSLFNGSVDDSKVRYYTTLEIKSIEKYLTVPTNRDSLQLKDFIPNDIYTSNDPVHKAEAQRLSDEFTSNFNFCLDFYNMFCEIELKGYDSLLKIRNSDLSSINPDADAVDAEIINDEYLKNVFYRLQHTNYGRNNPVSYYHEMYNELVRNTQNPIQLPKNLIFLDKSMKINTIHSNILSDISIVCYSKKNKNYGIDGMMTNALTAEFNSSDTKFIFLMVESPSVKRRYLEYLNVSQSEAFKSKYGIDESTKVVLAMVNQKYYETSFKKDHFIDKIAQAQEYLNDLIDVDYNHIDVNSMYLELNPIDFREFFPKADPKSRTKAVVKKVQRDLTYFRYIKSDNWTKNFNCNKCNSYKIDDVIDDYHISFSEFSTFVDLCYKDRASFIEISRDTFGVFFNKIGGKHLLIVNDNDFKKLQDNKPDNCITHEKIFELFDKYLSSNAYLYRNYIENDIIDGTDMLYVAGGNHVKHQSSELRKANAYIIDIADDISNTIYSEGWKNFIKDYYNVDYITNIGSIYQANVVTSAESQAYKHIFNCINFHHLVNNQTLFTKIEYNNLSHQPNPDLGVIEFIIKSKSKELGLINKYFINSVESINKVIGNKIKFFNALTNNSEVLSLFSIFVSLTKLGRSSDEIKTSLDAFILKFKEVYHAEDN